VSVGFGHILEPDLAMLIVDHHDSEAGGSRKALGQIAEQVRLVGERLALPVVPVDRVSMARNALQALADDRPPDWPPSGDGSPSDPAHALRCRGDLAEAAWEQFNRPIAHDKRWVLQRRADDPGDDVVVAVHARV
jgi:hypothetical protein